MRLVVVSLSALTMLGGARGPATRVASVPAAARDTAVVHVSGSAVDSAFRSLAASTSTMDFARDLPTGDVARYQLVALNRRTMGPAELHETWSDIVVVRSGKAVLRTGSALAERSARGAGEFVGTSIPKGSDRTVGPGDMLVIPAGLAHQWRPTGGAAFSYVVLKVHPGAASAGKAR